jgi:hypothetical protein
MYVRRCELDLTGSGRGPIVLFHRGGYEYSISTRTGNFMFKRVIVRFQVLTGASMKITAF